MTDEQKLSLLLKVLKQYAESRHCYEDEGVDEDFESGVDFFEGIKADHEVEYDNLKYTQYRWDNRSILYYIDAQGQLVQRINQGYSYPTGVSSNG